jgi:hypothetical protein
MSLETKNMEFHGLNIVVEFDYSPEEPMVMYYPDGSGYPGCPAEVEITSVMIEGKYDAIDLFDTFGILPQLEEVILDEINEEQY